MEIFVQPLDSKNPSFIDPLDRGSWILVSGSESFLFLLCASFPVQGKKINLKPFFATTPLFLVLFAAGMSGGIAYIYNEKSFFDEKKFNLEMVELENLNKDDIKKLKENIKSHLKYTNSNVAKKILNSWSKEIKNFIKVMPSDYKKALEIIKKQKLNKLI